MAERQLKMWTGIKYGLIQYLAFFFGKIQNSIIQGGNIAESLMAKKVLAHSVISYNFKLYDITYINYGARVTLKTYLPVKRIGNKFLVLPGHHNGYRQKCQYQIVLYRRIF